MHRRLLTWVLLLVAASVLLLFVPGFDVLSFPFALVLAPLLAMGAGGLATTATVEARAAGGTLAGAWGRSFKFAAALSVLPWAVASVGSLLNGPCDYGYGLLFYLVGPVASALAAVVLGVAAGALVPGRRTAHAVYAVAFALAFVPAVADLLREPVVFFYSPFLGYYPGPIYDDRIEVRGAYWAFRAFCLLASLALAALVHGLAGPRFERRVDRRARTWMALGAALGAAATLWGLGGTLGFRVTRADVEAALPGVVADRWCEIRHAPTLSPEAAARLLADCGFRHRQVAAFFGLEPGDPVRVYLYPDADTKARLMGARHVEVTKPWLGEVHLTELSPGDMVLGHEVAHVVAGRLAPGPLRMPSRWGVLPDLPMVEGLAVAAAFADDGPSPHAWSLAMIQAGVPADPVALFSPGSFLAAQPGRAYTVAGSFVRFVSDRHGPEALRALAAGEGFEAATGRALPELVDEWRDWIAAVAGDSLDDDLRLRASGRFSGPGVLSRRCPVDVARSLARADEAEAAGDLPGAVSCLEAALADDPGRPSLRRELARLLARSGEARRAQDLLAEVPDDPEHPPAPGDRIAAADVLALAALSAGDPPPWEARVLLQRTAAVLRAGPEGRSVAARLAALDLPPPAGRAVFDLLAGAWGEDDPSSTLAAALPWAPDSGLLHYLLGRSLAGAGDYAAALPHLAAALALGLPGETPDPGRNADPRDRARAAGPFRPEAEKLLGRAAFWAGAELAARFHLLRALEIAPYDGDRAVLEEYLARLAGR